MLIRVRPAKVQDQDFVIEAARRLAAFELPPWRAAHELVGGEVRTLDDFFERGAAGAVLLIAVDEAEEPLGFAFVETVIDYFSGAPHAHLGILAVTEAAEGRGAARALLKAAEDWSVGEHFDKLTLNVFERNRHARAVYEHCGYEVETLRYVKLLR